MGGRSDVEARFLELRRELAQEERDLSRIMKSLDQLQALTVGNKTAKEEEEEEDAAPNSETFLAHMQQSTASYAQGVAKLLGEDEREAARGRKRKTFFVMLLYPLVFLKAISWGLSAVLLIIAALTVANPGTDNGPLFLALVLVIISSSISDALDQRINVVTSQKFRADIFLFKYVFWAVLEALQVTAAVLVRRYGATGEAANINLLIAYIGIADGVVALVRIVLESAAFLLGPVDAAKSAVFAQRSKGNHFKFLPQTDWNDLFNV